MSARHSWVRLDQRIVIESLNDGNQAFVEQKKGARCAPLDPGKAFLEQIVCRPFWRCADNFLHYAGKGKSSTVIGRTRVRQHRVGIASGQNLQECDRTVYIAIVPLRQSPAKTIVWIFAIGVRYS